MDAIINIANDGILIKDMSDLLDFDKIDFEFKKTEFATNGRLPTNNISKTYDFFDSKSLKAEQDAIVNECENYLRYAQNTTEFTKLRMTHSWANITRPNTDRQDPHNHPFSVVSGVLFLDDHPANLNFFIETMNRTIPFHLFDKEQFLPVGSIASRFTEIENGLKHHMVLFLSTVNHYVIHDRPATERRSLAFNTFWSGKTGPNDPMVSLEF